jgi:hypothetical protein
LTPHDHKNLCNDTVFRSITNIMAFLKCEKVAVPDRRNKGARAPKAPKKDTDYGERTAGVHAHIILHSKGGVPTTFETVRERLLQVYRQHH